MDPAGLIAFALVQTVSPGAAPAVAVEAEPVMARCDARPFQRLRGRSMADLLNTRLPQGSRVVRVDDPMGPADALRGRLVVEIGRNTRVRRVYCG